MNSRIDEFTAAINGVLLTGVLLCSHVTSAQTAPLVTLPAAIRNFSEEFSDITSLREIKGGRLLITDRKDSRIIALNTATGVVTVVGRQGQGPNEYPTIMPVWPIGGDSSVMIFIGGSRWLMLDGANIVSTLSSKTPAVAAAKSIVRGTNDIGDVFASSAIGIGGSYGDSTPLLRINRATGKIDTVTKLKGVAVKRSTEPGNPEGSGYFQTSVPALQVTEQSIPFPDGWIAITRLDPYRVDWRSPTGVWTRGAPMPFTNIPMTDAEKQTVMERSARKAGKAAEPFSSLRGWPEIVPPYAVPVTLFAAPDGRAIIGRLPSIEYPKTRYDIVSRSGKLEAQLELSANEKLAGFGAGKTVYVVTTDDNGIQRLSKRNWLLVMQR
ncbi:MAG: hypothetical protein ABJB74_12765 [Gemmatimonas sp.]